MKRQAVHHRRTPLMVETRRDGERELASWVQHKDRMLRWQQDLRPRALRLIAQRTARLPWSPALLSLLLEELHVEDFFVELIGTPERISLRRYPQAIAFAIALRHSWRPEDLTRFARHLGITLANERLVAR